MRMSIAACLAGCFMLLSACAVDVSDEELAELDEEAAVLDEEAAELDEEAAELAQLEGESDQSLANRHSLTTEACHTYDTLRVRANFKCGDLYNGGGGSWVSYDWNFTRQCLTGGTYGARKVWFSCYRQ